MNSNETKAHYRPVYFSCVSPAVYRIQQPDFRGYPAESSNCGDGVFWIYAGRKGRYGSWLCQRTFYGFVLPGFYALIYTVIGYLNGTFHRMFFDDDIKFPLILIGVSDLVYGLAVYVCLFMLHGEFIFSYFLGHVILPELVYTILVTLILYQIILHVNRRLEAEEQRSASKFV